jgi:hypothetical protein
MYLRCRFEPVSGTDFAAHLEAHHQALVEEIARVEQEIAFRTQHLRQLQLKLESVFELMKVEGIAPPQAHRHFLEVAHDVLLQSGPRHYVELASELRAQGVLIPGAKPEANLLAHMSRDSRFQKVGRGIYAVGATHKVGGRPKKTEGKKRQVPKSVRPVNSTSKKNGEGEGNG